MKYVLFADSTNVVCSEQKKPLEEITWKMNLLKALSLNLLKDKTHGIWKTLKGHAYYINTMHK